MHIKIKRLILNVLKIFYFVTFFSNAEDSVISRYDIELLYKKGLERISSVFNLLSL